MIQDVVGYEGEIVWNTKMKDGTPRKLLNVDKLKNLGWQAQISLKDGIRSTLQWCLKNNAFKDERN